MVCNRIYIYCIRTYMIKRHYRYEQNRFYIICMIHRSALTLGVGGGSVVQDALGRIPIVGRIWAGDAALVPVGDMGQLTKITSFSIIPCVLNNSSIPNC